MTIALPFGGQIESQGREYITGAHIHVQDAQGQIIFRAIAAEFGEKPRETAKAFLEALAELMPNIDESAEEEGYAFSFEGCYLVGTPESLSLVLDYEKYLADADNDDNEIIYYAIEEWKESPEEVLGALLNCLAENA